MNTLFRQVLLEMGTPYRNECVSVSLLSGTGTKVKFESIARSILRARFPAATHRIPRIPVVGSPYLVAVYSDAFYHSAGGKVPSRVLLRGFCALAMFWLWPFFILRCSSLDLGFVVVVCCLFAPSAGPPAGQRAAAGHEGPYAGGSAPARGENRVGRCS